MLAVKKVPVILVFLAGLALGAFVVLPAADVMDSVFDQSEPQPWEKIPPILRSPQAAVAVPAQSPGLVIGQAIAAGHRQLNDRSRRAPVHPASDLVIFLDHCLRR